MSIFVTTAYRWGDTEETSYAVYVGCDRSEALRQARKQNVNRGFKYAMETVEYSGEVDMDGEAVGEAIDFVPADLGPEDRAKPWWDAIARESLASDAWLAILNDDIGSLSLEQAWEKAREYADAYGCETWRHPSD